MSKLAPILISLASVPERREGMIRQFTSAGWDYVIQDACDYRSFVPPDAVVDGEVFSALYKRQIRGGEVGCYMSHLAALERGLSCGMPGIWVIEDDVVIMKDWDAACGAVEGAIREIATFVEDSWILYCSMPLMHGSLRELRDGQRMEYCREIEVGCVGTQSYILSEAAAMFVLDYGRLIERPIDEVLRIWQIRGRIKAFTLNQDFLPIRPDWDIESVIAPPPSEC